MKKAIIFLWICFTVVSISKAQGGWVAMQQLTGYDLKSVYFVNEQIGYVISNANLFKTTDGGNTWNQPCAGFTYIINKVYFIDENIGIIVGHEGKIYRTTDGGGTWSNAITGTNSYNFYDVDFSNSTTGYAVGTEGSIFLTTDGGQNWNIIYTYGSNPLKVVVAPYNQYGYAAGEFTTFFRSTDGGINWGEETIDSLYSHFSGMQFISDLEGWMSGSGGFILHTSDGGENWTQQTTNTTLDLNDLWSTNYLNVYAVGEAGTMLKTTDGGSNWTPYYVPTQADLHSVFFVDFNVGFVVGDSGVIFKTYSGGAPVYFVVTPDSLTLSGEVGSNANFDIVSNTTWNININQTWLTANIYNGANAATITLTAEANPLSVSRLAVVNIWGDNASTAVINVLQLPTDKINKSEIKIVSFHPNPIKDVLYVEGITNISEIKILDITGKIIEMPKMRNNTIDFSHLNSGVYFISFINNGNAYTKRVIKL